MEEAVLEERLDAVFFQVGIVFLAAISCIGCTDTGIKAVTIAIQFQMGLEGEGIVGVNCFNYGLNF